VECVSGIYSFPDPRDEALKLVSRFSELLTPGTGNPVIYLLLDRSGSNVDAMRSTVNFLKSVFGEVRGMGWEEGRGGKRDGGLSLNK
jgi:hypothetical protein